MRKGRDMDKLDPKTDGATPDIVEQNIEKMKVLFPEVFTEGRVDLDALRETLGDYADERQERYSFTWNGKSRARRIAQTPSTGTLRPCPEESVNWEKTQNLFIEGDNLEVLKLLQKSYHKKVKMIYIDPPYNTGKEFIYPDKFQDNLDTYLRYTGQKNEEGLKLSANAETSGRYHTNWLNMMLPRLKLARNLLNDDGVIFISIDDNEAANLKKLCDEIFNEENQFGIFQWRRRQRADNRNQSNVSPDHEYIFAYSKSEKSTLKGLNIDTNKYKNPDGDPRGPWASIDLSGLATADQRPNLHYDIVNPETGDVYPPNPNRGWSKSRENVDKMIKEGRILFPKSPKGRPREKKFLSDLLTTVTGFSTCLEPKKVGFTTNGTREVTSLLKGKYFDFPKPSSLIKTFVEQATSKEDIIFDFFAGSCTSAHAVLDLNKEDSGSRKFIMVQLPEPCDEKSEAFKAGYKTIADIGKERIRSVIKKLSTDDADERRKKEGNLFENNLRKSAQSADNLDLGFKVFKLDSSNIKLWDADFDKLEESLFNAVENIKTDRSEAEVLYELLLKYGLDLAVPIEERKIEGKTVYIIGAGALIVCLSRQISLQVVDGIAALRDELKPEVMRVVFKDSGFADDVVKTNAVQILRQARYR